MDKHLYFKNLDASRFFAFLLVFQAHCFIATDSLTASSSRFLAIYQWGKVGILGLEYFFVLSSFLISMIILEERRQTSDFHIFNFLVRRGLRVWPLYFLIVLIGWLSLFLSDSLGLDLKPLPPWYNLTFFLVNFYIISHGSNFLFFIAFLWSVSVEEQFYLIWSVIMKRMKNNFPVFCIALIIISLIFRYLYLDDDKRLFFHTVSAFGNFGAGGLLAFAIFQKNAAYNLLSNLNKPMVIASFVIMVLSIAFYHELMRYDLFRVFERMYYSLFFVFFIADQTIGKNRLFNGGNIPVFNYLGKISYGLYCFHGIVITVFIKVIEHLAPQQPLFEVVFVFPLVIFLLTLLVSHLSYRYFEFYFLNLKKKFYNFNP